MTDCPLRNAPAYAPVQIQPAYVYKIALDVGNQEHIDKVRILSKERRIIHTSNLSEIGLTVDRKADACVRCHESEQPLEQIPRIKRSRTWAYDLT